MSNSHNSEAGATDLAVVGMFGRFPGAPDVDAFWDNLRHGRSSVTTFSAADSEPLPFADGGPAGDGEHLIRAAGILDQADCFDAAFFGYTPKEASIIDPQQRLFLEACWAALEHAGYDPRRVELPVGVFGGASLNTYLLHVVANPALARTFGELLLRVSNDKDFLANRVSYKLDLAGPSVVVQSGCSTSLTAVHFACQSLLTGECDLALAGGVSLRIPQRVATPHVAGSILSPDGVCRPFDAGANGTVGGSGVGVVVLRRLADALAAGDRIYAVVKGSAVNNDGAAKVGYTAPSVRGQADVIRAALAVAAIPPESVGYIEAHGTGTLLGDPIEVEALALAYGPPAAGQPPRALGSVKANIGHLDAAAGIASFIKATLAVYHGELVPTAHFARANPALDLDGAGFTVDRQLRAWDGAGPRRAGVSSFGMGGTNVHLLLEEPPPGRSDDTASASGAVLLPLSARDPAALAEARARLAAHLAAADASADLADIAYTLQVGRSALATRSYLAASSLTEARRQLSEAATPVDDAAPASPRPVVFLFPGQGTQRAGIAASLYPRWAVFRRALDDCRAQLAAHDGIDVFEWLCREPAAGDVTALTRTEVAQPVLFAFEYALARQWMAWGLRPVAMVGHSLGELVAACVADVLALPEAIRFIVARARAMAARPAGAMLSVATSRARIDELCRGTKVEIAAFNGPELFTLAGVAADIVALEARCGAAAISCRRLETSHAFHSAQMGAAVAPLTVAAAALRREAPQIPFVSNVHGGWFSAADAADASYFARHVRAPLRIDEGLRAVLQRHPDAVFIEVGAGRVLASLLPANAEPGTRVRAVAGLRSAADAERELMAALGQAWALGAPVDWPALHEGETRRRVGLPTYPFARVRCWIDPPARVAAPVTGARPAAPVTAAPMAALETAGSASQRLIAGIWQELLGIADIGVDRDFFEVGGHSLIATQLVARIAQKTGVHLPLKAVFERPTIAGLAGLVDAAAPTAASRTSIVPRRDGGDAPLSFAQQRLWFVDQLTPGRSTYNLVLPLRLRGALDVAVLKRAFAALVERHEALRTIFPCDADGRPRQQVLPRLEVPMPLADLSRAADPEAEARQLVLDATQAPFDLARGPLVRAQLARLGADHHVLVIVLHHIICDGWSMGVMARDMSALYTALRAGDAATLPPLAVQYSDYACWQRDAERDGAREPLLDYWRAQLADLPALELPLDRPRPPVQSGRGELGIRRMSPALQAALASLARQEDVTLFMILTSVFQLLLSRYANQKDVAIGTAVAGRRHSELEPLIGCFVNLLVLRGDLGGDPSLAELLARARRTCLDAYEHQELPFDALVEALGVQRSLERSPLFQCCLVLQNTGKTEVDLGPVQLEVVEVDASSSLFDMRILFSEERDGLIARYEHNSDILDAGTMARMMGHFEQLLRELVGAADRLDEVRVSQLRMVAEEERQELLAAAGTGTRYGAQTTIHEVVRAQAERRPQATALRCQGRELSYGELERRANQVARALMKRGVGTDVRVGVCLERSEELVMATLGVLKAGGAYVPLDPEYPRERLEYLVADSGARVVVTQRKLAEKLGGADGVELLCLEEAAAELAGEFDAEVPARGRADSLAYVIYTSGSTGKPKGVAITHHNVMRLLRAADEELELDENDVWSFFHSFAFDFSVWEIWGGLTHGATVVVVPYWESRQPEVMSELVRREGVTVLSQTPSAFRQLVRADEQQPPGGHRLRYVVFGGEKLEMAHVGPWLERHGDERPRLINMYGITETTVHVTFRRITRADASRGSVIGKPLADLELHVLDENLEPTPVGVAGELYIGGDGLARGYLNRPELTAERYVANPYGLEPGSRLYRSGDLARRSADGDVEYLGRIDHQVKIRGHRIELGEIENALLEHERIGGAVVLAREERLIGWVVPKGEAPTVGELRAHLEARLPAYMVPQAFVTLATLPLTANGKLDRRALPEPDLQAQRADAYVAPRDEVEGVLCRAWAQALGLERVGIDDNYFALGGDSIRSIEVRALARAAGVDFAIQQLFEHQTVRRLARAAGQAGQPELEPLQPFALVRAKDRARVAATVEDAFPLAQLQAGMLFHSGFSDDATAYHDVFSFHLRCRLDIAALQRALADLVAAQPILRTSLHLADFSQLLQCVHRDAPTRLATTDLTGLPDDEQERHIRDWIERERRRAIDPAQPPLLTVHVHRRAHDRVQLSYSFHHAILDGWSVSALTAELFARHHAYHDGAVPPPRLTLPFHFGHFVALEQRAAADPETLAFWQGRLAQLPPVAAAGARSRHHAGARQTLISRLPPETVGRVRAAAVAAGVPLKTIFLAAHLRALAIDSGQARVATGLVSNGRPEVGDADKVLGLFLNTLPIAADTGVGDAGALWQALLAAERELLPHRRFPMARLRKLNGERPLFDSTFNFTHFRLYGETLRQGEIELLDSVVIEETDTPLTVQFSVDPRGDQVGTAIAFDTSVVTPERAARLAALHQALLDEWTGSPAPSPSPSPGGSDRRLHRPFEAQARQQPERVAVCDESSASTYRELNDQANRLARYLVSLGVGPDVLVAISLERSVDLVVAQLAVLKAGGGYVPLDPEYPAERLRYMAGDARAAVVLTRPALARAWVDGPGQLVHVDAALHARLAESFAGDDLPPVAGLDDSLAYVIYTSGSTGTPKGVAISHRAVCNHMAWMQAAFALASDDVVLQKTPSSFDASVWEFHAPLWSGARLVMAPPGAHRDTRALAELVARHGVTTLQLVPSLLAPLADEPGLAECAGVLRRLFCGGEALPVPAVQAFARRLPDCRVYNLYGPTECTIDASAHACTPPGDGDIVPIGAPIDNLAFHILDADLEPVAPGQSGELYIEGIGVARGYLHRPELTAERFLAHPAAAGAGGRLYRTGDHVRRRGDGAVEFLGRVDQQVKIRGVRIELGEIEAVLRAQSGIGDAVCVAHGQWLVAFVVAGELPAPGELRDQLARRLPAAMLPHKIALLPELPRTPGGKIDRSALAALAAETIAGAGSTATGRTAPATAVEQLLFDIWQEVLPTDHIGTDDNFFELGGDSITTLQVAAKARQRGLRLTPKELFEHPTIRDLARACRLDEAAAREGTPSGAVELTPIQRHFFARQLPNPSHWNQSVLLEVAPDVDHELLAQALGVVAKSHDALWLRFAPVGGRMLQHFDGAERRPAAATWLARGQLPAQPEALEEAVRTTVTALQEGLDLGAGRLIRGALLAGGAGRPALLCLVVHHLVIDGVSWRILLEDVKLVYQQLRRGQPLALPVRSSSYARWAEALVSYAGADRLADDVAYWLSADWQGTAAIPVDFAHGADDEASTRHVELVLDRDETAWLLQRLPAVARVQPEEALLSAVARALGQWSGSERVAIDLEGHGREPVGDELEVSRTVGWFTALAPLLVDTRARRADGAALTLAKRARARLQALPQRGLPFMVGRALETAVSARLRALPKRQVSFNYLGQFDSLFADGTLFRPSTIAVGGDRDPQAPREYLLDISALIVDEQLRIAFSYGCNRHARPTIETLAARTVGFLRELIGAAQCGGATAWDAADFSDLQWNEDDAEAVLAAVQASLCEGDE